jgi:hypothetical protein
MSGHHLAAIGLHHCAERLRRLSLARENLIPEIDEPQTHSEIGQCFHGNPPRRRPYPHKTVYATVWRSTINGRRFR